MCYLYAQQPGIYYIGDNGVAVNYPWSTEIWASIPSCPS